MITIVDASGNGIRLERPVLIGVLVAFIVILVAFYMLRSFGLYKLAKRRNFKNAWLSFIPIGWVYVAGLLAGEIIFFGARIKKFQIIALIVIGLSTIASIFNLSITTFPPILSALKGNKVTYLIGEGFVNSGIVVSEGLYVFLRVFSIFTYVLDIASIFVEISLYSSIFKRYFPLHHLSATILSFLGLFPIFIFVVRNRTPVAIKRFNGGYNFVNPNQNQQQPRGEDPFDSDFDKKQKDVKDIDPFDNF